MRPVDEPPGADPHAGWCGEGGLKARPYPIGLSVLEQFIKRNADVFGDLAEQDCGDVSALMKRNRRKAACRIAKLLMRSALADFDETKFHEDGGDLIGFENGNVAHNSRYGDVLDPDKLRFQHGLSIFQKHCNNIVQVAVDFIQCLPLRMSAGKTGNKTNEQSRLRAPLDYR